MKKIVLMILLSYCMVSKAQVAYYDAINLKRLGTELVKDSQKICLPERDSVLMILKYYVPVSDSNSTKKIKNNFSDNPFMHYCGGSKGDDAPDAGKKSFASSIANFDVTTIADGLAKFLVNRVKEELSVAFFEQLKQDFNNEKYSDLRILFPQTARLLNLIDQKVYQFSAYLTDLRDAFILDLNNLPSSAIVVVNLPKYHNYFVAHQALKRAFQTGLFISGVLVQKNKLKDIGKIIEDTAKRIDAFFSLDNKTGFDTTVNASFKTLQLISNSLRSLDTTGVSDETQRYWLSTDSLYMLINDPATLKIYLGLIYQQAHIRDITFAGNKKLTDVLQNTNEVVENIRNSISSFHTELNAYEEYRRQYRDITKGLQKDSINLYYYGLYNSSLGILESGLSLTKNWNLNYPPVIDSLIPAMHDAGEIFMYTNQKKYGPAILSLVKLYSDVIQLVNQNKKDKKLNLKFIARLSTYGSFISQVANAENSDQVAAIIQKTVLPTGSSYIKKHSVFNIALQAYTGLYGGYQRQATDISNVGVAGVYAPVGIAFSWGLQPSNTNKSPGSLSIFASLVDIGPLVSFRFSHYNDTIANDVKVRLSQIVSPGAHLIYGVPKLPISFGVGCNWSPLITNVEKDKITVASKNAFRYQAFIAVDIPLLNFHNKPR